MPTPVGAAFREHKIDGLKPSIFRLRNAAPEGVSAYQSVILIEPYPEKLVVNAINALLVRNEILFE